MTSTLVELLRGRAESSADATAFRFLSDDTSADSVTYGELDRGARTVAAHLSELGAGHGDRVLLLYPPGLDYVRAFFGALYAGAVPVPAYPPRTQRNVHRLGAITADSRAGFALTTGSVLEVLAQDEGDRDAHMPRTSSTDGLDPAAAEAWSAPATTPQDLAFIQYTSGSTGSPKGVTLTQGNLLHNLGMISRAFGCRPDSSAVIWLPPYHDMGLIGGILTPLYEGFPVTLMAPMSFLRRPMHWLHTISREGAELSGAPNFAYELCARVATDEDRETLDLSSWRVAFNGAEPIRAATLDAFTEAFGACGFRRRSFLPCYGLAEATLLVTGAPRDGEPRVFEADADALAAHRAEPGADGRTVRRLVGSGTAAPDQDVLVVDPESRQAVSERRIGEIWVRGASVASGYWDNPAATEETFGARLAGPDADGPYLRTGDLGFTDGGELFVTGRRKDLIIIRGRNVYPTDIEQAAERSHPAFRPGCTAAVAVEHEGEQAVVVVQEVEGRSLRTVDADEATARVRDAVMAACDLAVHDVVLVRPGAVPKTTSGKVQRSLCREQYLTGALQPIGTGRGAGPAPEPSGPAAAPAADPVADALRRHVAERLAVPVGAVATDVPLTSLGIDSLAAVLLANRVQDELGVELPMGRMLGGAGITELAAAASLPADAVPAGRVPAADGADDAGDAESGTTLGQQAIWHLQQQYPDSTAYNIPVALRLHGPLDAGALRRSLEQVSLRHETLRTRYRIVDGRTVAHVDPAPVPLECLDASADDEDRLAERVADLAHRPFDLRLDPALRAWLLSRSAESHVLLLSVHHIAVDLWSLVVLTDELGRCYRAEATGSPLELPAPPATYADQVRRERNLLAGPAAARLETYWKQALAGPLPVLDLSADHPYPPIPSHRGERIDFRLDAESTSRLRSLAAETGVTLYSLLLSAFHVVLHHVGGQEDVLVGSPTANRGSRDVEDVVGYFVNMVPIRSRLAEGTTLREFTGQVHRTVLAALDHQTLPFPRLLEIVQPPREPGRNPLFQAVFALQRPHAHTEAAGFVLGTSGDAAVSWGTLRLEPYRLAHRTAQYELMLTVADAGADLHAALEYSTDVLTAGTAARLADHYRAVLTDLLERPDAEVAGIRPDGLRRGPADATANTEDDLDGYVAPGTDTERILAKIWSEVLGVEPVGAEDDFYDLGGHSLLAVQLISAVRDELGVEVPVRSVMQTRTVRQGAAVIDALLWARDSARAAGDGTRDGDREEGQL
ncbi:condensation domain-containing protein [Streptomyces sp. NPDC007070]|uniref:condensation domain-containing protein n=1 Tax=Streptomyces sp. NPDC007070 TaxID=3154312 RepID=UPI0033DABF55